MTTLEQSFTAWADREFGPAPDPTIPQTVRFASYWKCWQAAQPQRTGNAIRDAFAAINQCDGCAAGMQVNYMGNHVGADGRPHMGCTSDRYEQSVDSSTHQPNGAPPQATAVGTGIEMSVGVDVLCHAAAFHPDFWDGQSGPDVPNIKITDPAEFAREVASAINRESEDGSSLLTRMLDEAVRDAVESGCEGVNHA